MKKHASASTTAGALGLAALALIMSSCASSNYVAVDHRAYAKTPDCASSKFNRFVSGLPGLKGKSRWGRWGGSGNLGGMPIDWMDEGFRRHDIVYYESRCGKHLRVADRELVEWLENMDEDSLDSKQLEFRKRAIKFMNSPLANIVGKPPLVMLRKKEKRDDCYFCSPEIVEAFFDPNHSGFPYAPEIQETPVVRPLIAKPVGPGVSTGPLLAEVENAP